MLGERVPRLPRFSDPGSANDNFNSPFESEPGLVETRMRVLISSQAVFREPRPGSVLFLSVKANVRLIAGEDEEMI